MAGLNYATYHGYESDKSKMTFESGVKIFSTRYSENTATGSCSTKLILKLAK